MHPPADEPRPDDGPEWDRPAAVAALVAAMSRPTVLAFDIDGTLAPLAPHPSSSRLSVGVAAALRELTAVTGVTVAVVSGRPWSDVVGQFGFGDDGIVVIGSHGLELGRPGFELGPDDRRRSARLAMLAASAAARAPGAWVEHKPAGVALHVRQAPPALRAESMRWFVEHVEGVGHVDVLPGHAVVDVSLRRYDKGEAITWLRRTHGASSVLFVGDDVTDELAFVRLGDADLAVKVGGGDSLAGRRLADPDEVAAFVVALAGLLDRGRPGERR